jgi:hypothetical protein
VQENPWSSHRKFIVVENLQGHSPKGITPAPHRLHFFFKSYTSKFQDKSAKVLSRKVHEVKIHMDGDVVI